MAKTNLSFVHKRNRRRFIERNERKGLVVVSDGNDVEFNIGSGNLESWKGSLTSEMAADHEGRKILRWIIDKNDFDDEAQEIIQQQLESVWI